MEKNIHPIIRKIADVLMLQAGFLENPGLFSGEMGLVLFFSRFARLTRNDLYLVYSYELMERLKKRIYRHTPIDYKDGLAGIGAAIEYLVQTGLLESDTDVVLKEFDRRMLFSCNLSLLPIAEIIDVGYYAAWRLSGSSAHKEAIRQTVLPQLTHVMNENAIVPAWERAKMSGCWNEKSYSRCLKYMAAGLFWNNDLGLQSGLAGWGLSLMTELDGDDSWMSLLPDDLYD